MSFSTNYPELDKYLKETTDSDLLKIKTFAKYSPRQNITEFITRYEIFKKILSIHGSIAECGVNAGQGLFTWAKLSSILEPYNFTRQIFGFDTFMGFPSLTDNDKESASKLVKMNGASYDDFDNIVQGIKVHDSDRALAHIQKIKLFKGDINETVPKFAKENSDIFFSLINVDVDIESPTQTILEYLYPMLVRGGIMIFDEVSNPLYKGESIALKNSGINLKLERFPFEARICYAIKE